MINETRQEADLRYMKMALDEAREAGRQDEVPIGAVVVSGGRVIARTRNMTEQLTDVCAHAEILAITAASEATGGKYHPEATLYVTVEPCPMCAAALAWAQMGRIVYGAPDPKRGYRLFETCRPLLHPRTEVTGGVMEQESRQLMQNFFKSKR